MQAVISGVDTRTMCLHQAVAEVEPFRVKRSVPSSANNGAPGALYWSMQMVAVSIHRDCGSFMRICDHFVPRLRRYLRNPGMPESMADELVEEALLTLWRKPGMFDPARASPATWLYRVARNLHLRGSHRCAAQVLRLARPHAATAARVLSVLCRRSASR